MINNFISTKNNKNLHYLDTINTVATKNGFVFNIVDFHNEITNKSIYELRMGYLEQEDITPVITLYKNENYQKVLYYLKSITSNASEIYIFKH